MRRKAVLVLVLVVVLSVISIGAVSAGTLGDYDRTGELDLSLNAGAFFDPPQLVDGVAWYGTVTFDDAGVFGIVYKTVPSHASQVVSHWTETWEIYAPGDYDFVVEEGVLISYKYVEKVGDPEPEPIVVGFDKGITHLKKSFWLGNGPVLTAEGPLAHLEGRQTHTKGTFSFMELSGEGTIRFN